MTDIGSAKSPVVVEIRNVTRRFGSVVAMDDVSLAVPRGTVFGLVGVNAAGKTTLIKHVLGLLKPQTGTVRVFGRPGGCVVEDRLSLGRERPARLDAAGRADSLHAGVLSDLGRGVRGRAAPVVRSRSGGQGETPLQGPAIADRSARCVHSGHA